MLRILWQRTCLCCAFAVDVGIGAVVEVVEIVEAVSCMAARTLALAVVDTHACREPFNLILKEATRRD